MHARKAAKILAFAPAIFCCVASVYHPVSPLFPSSVQMAACHLGSPSLSMGPSTSSHPTPLPFVLIQGPPGTGKTHTVRGVLNVWHLVAYQTYFASLMHLALGKTAGGSSAQTQLPLGIDLLVNGQGGGVGIAAAAPRPRILVCTPSNAACDELMSRVMSLGFCDGRGETGSNGQMTGRYSYNSIVVWLYASNRNLY